LPSSCAFAVAVSTNLHPVARTTHSLKRNLHVRTPQGPACACLQVTCYNLISHCNASVTRVPVGEV
jgi:hypothetical protein